jgi:hypothetical protein
MTGRSPVAALAWGTGGGALAAVLFVGVSLVDGGAGHLAEYAGLATGLIGVHLGMRGAAGLTPQALLWRAGGLALLASAALGAAAFAVYGWWRPALLTARFDGYLAAVTTMHAPPARVATELARLHATRAQYLDPLYQAVSLAGTLFFFAMLLGGFVAFGAHKARRFQGPARRA